VPIGGQQYRDARQSQGVEAWESAREGGGTLYDNIEGGEGTSGLSTCTGTFQA
jgi:hypothetical protein